MKPTSHRRNLWPVAIVTYLTIFATFLAIYIIWALGQKQDLVSEDYYEHEVRYQEQLDRLNRAHAQAAPTAITFDAVQNCIVIALPANTAGTTGRIQLYRPSNARLDQEVPLALNAQGIQTLSTRSMATGLWKVRVAWSVDGQQFFLDQTVVVTGASASGSTRSVNTHNPPAPKPAIPS